MSKTIKPWTIGLALLAVASLFMADLFPEDTNRPITLSDGTTARLVSVTIGTHHDPNSPIHRLFNRLPDSIVSRFEQATGKALRGTTRRTIRTNLVVWIEQSASRH